MTQRYMIVAISCGPDNALPGNDTASAKAFLDGIGAAGRAVCMMDFKSDAEAAAYIERGIDRDRMFRIVVGLAEYEKSCAAKDEYSRKMGYDNAQ